MNVFISWSGDRSHEMARTLKWLLERCAPNARCWLSDDIPDGKLWRYVLAEALESSGFGICCVTRENREAPWLLFEAGAIAKAVGQEARLIPYLLDLEPTDLEEPLAGFQARRSTEAETRRMVLAIGAGESPDDVLRDHFEHYWPTVAERLKELSEAEPGHDAIEDRPIRSSDEMLRELLERTRRIEQIADALPSVITRTPPSYRDVLNSLRRDLLALPEVRDVELMWSDHELRADFRIKGIEDHSFHAVVGVSQRPELWSTAEYRFVVHELSDMVLRYMRKELHSVRELMDDLQRDSPSEP